MSIFCPYVSFEKEEGFVLLYTLSMIILVSLITISIINHARSFSSYSAVYKENIDARLIAEAGINRLANAVVSTNDPLLRSRKNNEKILWKFAGRELSLNFENESGKLDLNKGNMLHISNLINEIIPNERLGKRFLTWIRSHRENNQTIIGLPIALISPEKLLVLNLSRFFTVYSHQAKIDPFSAPEMVLQSLPNLSQEQALNIFKIRNMKKIPNNFSEIKSFFGRRLSIYRLTASVPMKNKSSFTLTAVIKIEGGNKAIHFLERMKNINNKK